MPHVYFQTFGCQMNVADSDSLAMLLFARGFTKCDAPENAGLIVVNTCSVRAHAEERALARIREFASIKQRNDGAQLWVMGCMAERLGEKLREKVPGVDLVIGARSIDSLEEIIDSRISHELHKETIHSLESPGVSEFIPIMRGCDNYCAYCIVPYVRGHEQSIPIRAILDKIKQRIEAGVVEFTLLGQNVNSYNDNGIDFPDLLREVASVQGLKRVRFTTSHPKDCSEKLVRTMAEIPQLCPHLHLPVQAGSDRILALMNRKYTASHYRSLIDMARSYIPQLDITTDLLVGFPTETDADFDQTLQLVKDVRFTTAFMFAYSVREGTHAASMQDDVPRELKVSRLAQLIDLQTQTTRSIYDSMVGKTLEVLITDRQEKRDRMWMGLDGGCKRILVACDEIKAGTILKVRAIRSSGMTLVCERSTNAPD